MGTPLGAKYTIYLHGPFGVAARLAKHGEGGIKRLLRRCLFRVLGFRGIGFRV